MEPSGRGLSGGEPLVEETSLRRPRSGSPLPIAGFASRGRKRQGRSRRDVSEPFGEVVSRALRPEIIPAQAAEELVGDGSYLLVGPLPRGSLGGETDVDLPSADLARAHQRGERRIRGAEKVADLLAQLLLADPGELEHHGDDRTLAALPDPGLERLLEHPCISAGTPGNVAKSTPSSSRRAPIAVPKGLAISSEPSGKRACL